MSLSWRGFRSEVSDLRICPCLKGWNPKAKRNRKWKRKERGKKGSWCLVNLNEASDESRRGLSFVQAFFLIWLRPLTFFVACRCREKPKTFYFRLLSCNWVFVSLSCTPSSAGFHLSKIMLYSWKWCGESQKHGSRFFLNIFLPTLISELTHVLCLCGGDCIWECFKIHSLTFIKESL